MRMFRNLTLFRFAPDAIESAAALRAAIESQPLRECGPMELATVGFVSPVGRDGPLTIEHGQRILFALGQSTKILPAAVIREELDHRIAEVKEREGRDRVGSRERQRMKEQILADFLPRAFTRPRRTLAYVDLATGWLVIDTATRSVAEAVATRLREAIGSFPCTPPTPGESVRATLTDWLHRADCSGAFTLGMDCDLRDPSDDSAKWTGRDIDLDTEEVRAHLAAGMQVFRLGLSFAERSSFLLGDDLVVRRFALSDVVLETLAQAQEVAETTEALVIADFILASSEIDALLATLAETFDIPREAKLVLDGGKQHAIHPKHAGGVSDEVIAKAAVDTALIRACAGLAPKRGSGIDSVTIIVPGSDHPPVTLRAGDGERMRRRARKIEELAKGEQKP